MYSVDSPPMSNWSRIYASPSYRSLVAQKTRVISVLTVFFIAYYFALPVLVAYWPHLMEVRVWGHVNLAYVFAFSQFLMAWAVAYVYMRYASRFDRMASGILAESDRSAEAGQSGAGE